jgi:hypothetical protein
MELIGNGCLLPLPPLSIGWADNNNLALNWPLSYGNAFALYSTTNLNATDGWTLIPAFIQTNGGQLSVTQSLGASAKFFRLQQP